MREEYAAKERGLEQHVSEIRDGSERDYSQFREFVSLPSELPRLDGHNAEFFYTVNLDHEVLTMNHSIHWKLGNIPRRDDLWLRAIADSVYRYKPTISPAHHVTRGAEGTDALGEKTLFRGAPREHSGELCYI